MRRIKVLTCCVAIASVLMFAASCMLEQDLFVDFAMFFSGYSREVSLPIVAKLFPLVRIFALCFPWVAFWLYCLVKWLANHEEVLREHRYFVIAAIIVGIFSLPDPVLPTMPGLDYSWQWMLNHVATSQAFGREVAFTYGPLGFLLVPMLPMENVLLSLLSSLAYVAIMSFALIALSRSGTKALVAAWLLLLTMLFPQYNLEWRWIALSVLLAIVPAAVGGFRFTLAFNALAGLVLALTSFMKFNALVIGFPVQIACVGLMMFGVGKGRLRIFLAWAIPFALTYLLLAAALFSSGGDFVSWVKMSLAVASGYNKYMVSDKSYLELVIPFVVCIIVYGTLAWGRIRDRKAMMVLAMTLPVAYCAVKYAIVRQSVLPLFYLLSVAIAVFAAAVPMSFRRALIMIACLWMMSIPTTLPRAIAGTYPSQFVLGINPVGIFKTLALPWSAAKAKANGLEVVNDSRLPETFRRKIGSDRVMFLPHEHAPAMGADSYDVVLLPTLQMYTAYLPELDARCAETFADRDVKWLVCDIDPAWCGHFINHPRIWSTIFCDYEIDEIVGERILLKAKGQRIQAETVAESSHRIREVKVGEWIDCRGFANALVSFGWRQTLVGKFCTTFLRRTPTWLSLRYADGREVVIPFNPENAAYQFSLRQIATDVNSFKMILGGGMTDAPVALKISAESPIQYEDVVTICSR